MTNIFFQTFYYFMYSLPRTVIFLPNVFYTIYLLSFLPVSLHQLCAKDHVSVMLRSAHIICHHYNIIFIYALTLRHSYSFYLYVLSHDSIFFHLLLCNFIPFASVIALCLQMLLSGKIKQTEKVLILSPNAGQREKEREKERERERERERD